MTDNQQRCIIVMLIIVAIGAVIAGCEQRDPFQTFCRDSVGWATYDGSLARYYEMDAYCKENTA